MSNDLHHLAAAYALDALHEVEHSAFEEHYPSCEICQQEVSDFRSIAAHLAVATSTVPPASLKARVMAEVNTTRQFGPLPGSGVVDELSVRRDRNRRFASVLTMAAAVVALVGASVFIVSSRGGNGFDDVVAAPDARVAQLAGERDGDVGSIRVVWSPSRDQLAFYGNDLPDLEEGWIYELWAITDTVGVISAGQFDPVDGTVRRVVDVDDVEPTAWAITVEPDGGSPVATTDIIYSAEA